MNVRLIDRQPATIASLRYVGPYGEGVSNFWQHTYYPWAATHDLLGAPRYGVSHDDPDVTAPEQCRYDAAAEVSPGFVASGGAQTATIAGGRYAVMAFKGNAEQVRES